MKIRFATPADAQAIAALHAASWRLTYGNALNPDYLQDVVPAERRAIWAQRFASPKENQCVLIAESHNEPVGFACVFAAEHHEWGSYLDNLHVSQPNQGRGIGKALLMQIARLCNLRAPGQGLYLLVNQDNRRAQQFYLRLGARNAESGVWNAPDGSTVPTFFFRWDSVEALAAQAPDG